MADSGCTPKKHAVVIGAGFAGLSTACSLAKNGWQVTVLEKNEQLGGRCRVWEKDGFTFDMGPSWYWMPEVFDDFFRKFGKQTSDYYSLKRLDPPYKVFFQDGKEVVVPDKMEKLEQLFESREKGAAVRLRSFLAQAAYKYKVGMEDYVWKPSVSWCEFLDPRLLVEVIRLQMLSSQRTHVQAHFKDPTLVQLMEWPVLFLGGSPQNIPAMYSMMNHAAIQGGTWWPKGGMGEIPKAMVSLAKELGVEFRTGKRGAVSRIIVAEGQARVSAVDVEGGEEVSCDVVVGAADYHHVEQELLDPQWRTYSESYWSKRVMSPSSLLFYIGLNRTVPNLEHHNLFFDEDIDTHVAEIYSDPAWPSRPLFYASVASQTEAGMAPKGSSALFLLVPLAANVEIDTEEHRESCYNTIMGRLEARCGLRDGELRKAVVLKRSYAHKEFGEDYNSYRGNAYGLANTLLQTAILKPSLRPGKLPNLYFAGQLTSPGPGVPPSIISGLVAGELIQKEHGPGAMERAEYAALLQFWALLGVLVLLAACTYGSLVPTAMLGGACFVVLIGLICSGVSNILTMAD